MDPLRDLEFKGAGSYWNPTGARRREPAAERISVPERSNPSSAQGDSLQTPIDLLGRGSPSGSESTSVACEGRNIMGPIKENGMAL